ncbi:MAG: hypothetical protein COB67_12170 [SAR324 cluster bacterium]|uniref:Uncharacterized protein n=1 Tax=SAR324 cluster bacterium TaxID=2024889 RepID=A0A2A4SRZ7_9DELT|nr:MAG: hypothetical protein COB67_12170 [SAR324 cluster bacterium]
MPPKALFFLLISLFFGSSLLAETRAYLLEVYDHISKSQWSITTGFAPDTYINSHGGGNRLSVMIKATWMCYGDTANFQPACPMPKAREPKFQAGDLVEVLLEKHITQSWQGRVELSLYREDLKSNVYGVRFGEKRQLYNRYYEFNLKLKQAVTIIKPPGQENLPENPAAEGALPSAIGTPAP